jgi:hypothetical protein
MRCAHEAPSLTLRNGKGFGFPNAVSDQSSLFG